VTGKALKPLNAVNMEAAPHEAATQHGVLVAAHFPSSVSSATEKWCTRNANEGI
jgi:hypothetical protein